MKITVNEQTQRFYLALKKWEPAIGHMITVGEYQFCAIPTGAVINVSEITSGSRIYNIPLTIDIDISTEDKESTMIFLKRIGESLARIITSNDYDFDELVKERKRVAIEKLGERPPIENVDTDWIFEKVDTVN